MPQLDKVTFFSQYFWLCVFFFGFYIFQLKFFLPEMSRILKFRKKRLSESSAVTLQGENNKVRTSTETALENLFKNLRNVFKESSSTNDKWLSEHRTKFSQDFKKGNLKYLQSIAKKCLSNNLAIKSVNTNFSSKIFLTLLTSRVLSQKSIAKRNYTTALSTASLSAKGKTKADQKKLTTDSKKNNENQNFSSSAAEQLKQSTAKKTATSKKGGDTKKKKKS